MDSDLLSVFTGNNNSRHLLTVYDGPVIHKYFISFNSYNWIMECKNKNLGQIANVRAWIPPSI